MKAIIPNFSLNSNIPIYIQLYDYIKSLILSNEIVPNEKLPSLRNLSDNLKISITTVELAYSQLLVEGYIYSKAGSGYYVNDILPISQTNKTTERFQENNTIFTSVETSLTKSNNNDLYDLNCFDFNKWKKCINKVLTQYPHLLLSESNPQGELALREEIAKYLYTSRGVKCDATQIVIAAGTQQITNHISNILKIMDIKNISVESPGYLPVINIFKDRGFAISHINVKDDGIDISALPTNISSAVYVNPSNQFPTGAVMPIGKRYSLIKWAENNNSYIIEDDYDSELRYFGRPVPSLQGLDNFNRVIYLGSFSSTLFSAIKISYMVLPLEMVEIFTEIRDNYSQTCSKTEQLALAFFMEDGKYQTGIKKLRRLYAQKLSTVLTAIDKYASDFVTPLNTSSGINIILSVKTSKEKNLLSLEAEKVGLSVIPANTYTINNDNSNMIFYYNQIPLDLIDASVKKLIDAWRNI